MPSVSRGAVLLARFWQRVQITDGCWVWTGQRNANGYGRITAEQVPTLAHRMAWTLMVGPIPVGKQVLHTCDNPPCVRPDHLRVGSQQDNLKDMRQKGRARRGPGFMANQQGVKHPTGDDHWTHRFPERVRRGDRHWTRLERTQVMAKSKLKTAVDAEVKVATKEAKTGNEQTIDEGPDTLERAAEGGDVQDLPTHARSHPA